jgi:peptidylprolyl isomerase
MRTEQRFADRPVRRNPWAVLLLAAAGVAAFGVDAGAANPAPAATSVPAAATPFAKVGDTVISHQEFEAAFAQAARSKFYHGKPPDNAIAALQREVGQTLVDEILLAMEAGRRKLQPDHAAIKQTLDGYDERYRGSEQWSSNRARLLPGLKAKLEQGSLLEQLTRQVKNAGDPTERQLEQYWEANKDKFTSPEQVHVAMILLKVEPSSPQPKWDGARDEGAAIVRRLRAGADFGQLARLHSSDESAERGGDMGFVHYGMLPEPAQKAMDQLKPGQISDAVVLLEGVAVFRLEDRKPPKLNPLDAVRDRARDLWLREQGEQAWTALLTKLRRETPVKLDDSRFLPLTTAAKSGESAAPR